MIKSKVASSSLQSSYWYKYLKGFLRVTSEEFMCKKSIIEEFVDLGAKCGHVSKYYMR